MSIVSPKPLEREDFRQVSPLGTDRSIFAQLEAKWRNLRAIRRMIIMPISVIGSVFPFLYVAVWPVLSYWGLHQDSEWWMWQVIAVLMGAFWFWASWMPYKKIKEKESLLDDALDALDAKDYVNSHLVELSTGRRMSNLNHLTPLSPEELVYYNDKTKSIGPKTEALWKRWISEESPIRVCDLFTLEKMILMEQWSVR